MSKESLTRQIIGSLQPLTLEELRLILRYIHSLMRTA